MFTEDYFKLTVHFRGKETKKPNHKHETNSSPYPKFFCDNIDERFAYKLLQCTKTV